MMMLRKKEKTGITRQSKEKIEENPKKKEKDTDTQGPNPGLSMIRKKNKGKEKKARKGTGDTAQGQMNQKKAEKGPREEEKKNTGGPQEVTQGLFRRKIKKKIMADIILKGRTGKGEGPRTKKLKKTKEWKVFRAQ
jgi:uncharacterized sporulation protein YeaH/YhbH (DUF444 family)